MKRLKAGLIGLGNQTMGDHLPGIKEAQFASLEAVCDTNAELAQKVGNEHNLRYYSSVSDMLSSEELDFVVVAVPHNEYPRIIEEVSKKGVHILKEKPFARTLDEANHFLKLSQDNNIQIMTTLQRRFNPIYSTFFQLADQIGEHFFIDSKYSLFVNAPHEGWRGNKKEAGGGCIIDMGYHMIDMVLWYFGLPDKIQAESSNRAKPDEEYDAEDTASILFSFDNGLYGSLTLSRFYAPKTEYLKLVGSRGVVDVQRGVIKRYKENGELAESLTRENAWPSASANQIDYFCRVIRGERENIGGPEYHIQHVSFVEACYKSMKEGKYINPKELIKNGKQTCN